MIVSSCIGRTRARQLSLALCLLAAATGARTEGEDPTVTAVSSMLSIELDLLQEDRARYAELAARRAANVAQLGQLREALDAAVRRDDSAAAADLEQLLAQVEQAAAVQATLVDAERTLLERLRERQRRVALFQDQIARLRGREQPAAGELTGAWDIVLLPQDQRGTFELSQTGTIVNGVYWLSGGFTGSLQGTLVQTKVYLQRIDSQLGRSMEFEGRLSGDRAKIRGTWHSLELSGGQPSSGQWSATRREPESQP